MFKNRENFGPSNIERESKEREPRSLFMSKLGKNRMARLFGIGALSLMSYGARGISSEIKGDQREISISTSESPEETFFQKAREFFRETDLGAKQHLFEKNPQTGKWDFQWLRILEPATIYMKGRDPENPNINFTVPYEYARKFDTGKPLDESDYEQMSAVIEKELEQQLAEQIHTLFYWDREAYGREAEMGNFRIKEMRIKGLTSPEARTPEDIEQGVVSDENIELGKLRAENAKNLIIKKAQEMGIEFDEDSIANIMSDELHYSEEEMDQLMVIAERYSNGERSLDKLYDLHVLFNSNQIENLDDLAELDRIINGKRKVEVEIDLAGKGKDTFVIPLPLILLLLLKRPRWKRGGGKTPKVPPVPQEDDGGTKIPEEKTPPKEPPTRKLPPEFKPLPNPEPWPEKPDQPYIETIKDIDIALDFYEPILEKYEDVAMIDWALFVNHLTRSILDAWTKNDNQMRERAGEPPLDHSQNPRQIFWAILHAEALTSLEEARRMFDAKAKKHITARMVWETVEAQEKMRQVIKDSLKEMGL